VMLSGAAAPAAAGLLIDRWLLQSINDVLASLLLTQLLSHTLIGKTMKATAVLCAYAIGKHNSGILTH